MRRYGDLRQLKERRISARFRGIDIKARTSMVSRLDRLSQGRFIYQTASRCINENLPLLGLCQKFPIKHSGSLGSLWQVNGHEIGTRHQFFQLNQFHAQRRRASRVGIGIVRDNGRLKGLQALGKELANVPKANNADGLSVDLHTLERRALPLPFAQGLVSRWYLARRR